MIKFLLSLFVFLAISTPQGFSQNSLEGIWEGGITVPGGELKVIFNINKTGSIYSGTLDIPQQGAIGLKLDPISQNEDSVSLTFKAGQVVGTFTGKFESATKISGNYSQGGPSTPFSVEQTSTSTNMVMKPENEVDFIIKNGDIEIGGTLTLPQDEIKAPLLIMNSGSGAQDRDSDIFGFKIFATIAQHLAEKGIPSFRFDDRGINESSGDFANATLNNLSSDVEAIMSFFQEHEDFNFQDFALLGHSQGGVIAGKVAAENAAVKQLILMGSTAPSLQEILRYQVEFAYSASPIDEVLVEKEILARENIMNAVVSGTKINEAKESYIQAYTELLNNLPETQRNSIPDIDVMVATQADQLTSLYSSPQLKSLLLYEPTKDLEKITATTLVLFGEKDTQVTITQNRTKIREALEKSGVDYEIKIFESANHLFQKANSGLANEYHLLEKKFVDGFLNHLSNWLISN